MALLDQNESSRAAVLARVRKALGRTDADARAVAEAEAYLHARRQGPRPSLPADLVAHFLARATDMASTVERIPTIAEVPAAVARYLDSLDLAPAIAEQKSHRGVCWPEFAHLDWRSHGLDVAARPMQGSDLLGVTGCFCAIAETGTLVFATAADSPSGTMLLPATHVAVVHAQRVVRGMEEVFDLVRRERAAMPRAINFVSGPSRTGDIEQTIVLGAHGPFRVHILLVD
jgi:L-lactate dehydrogenase complex protein LldG